VSDACLPNYTAPHPTRLQLRLFAVPPTKPHAVTSHQTAIQTVRSSSYQTTRRHIPPNSNSDSSQFPLPNLTLSHHTKQQFRQFAVPPTKLHAVTSHQTAIQTVRSSSYQTTRCHIPPNSNSSSSQFLTRAPLTLTADTPDSVHASPFATPNKLFTLPANVCKALPTN
jgi:hypothetical protein